MFSEETLGMGKVGVAKDSRDSSGDVVLVVAVTATDGAAILSRQRNNNQSDSNAGIEQ